MPFGVPPNGEGPSEPGTLATIEAVDRSLHAALQVDFIATDATDAQSDLLTPNSYPPPMSTLLNQVSDLLDRSQRIIDTAEVVLEWLRHYGWLHHCGDVVTAIRELQQRRGLEITGVLDRSTVRAIMAPRCGCPDFVDPTNPEHAGYLRLQAAIAAGRWNKAVVTWRIVKYLKGFQSTQDDIIAAACQSWMDVSGIILKQAPANANPDIVISSGRTRRDDFDGPGGTLAWAYLPQGNDAQLQLKFDESESWNSDILMENVACHELGHILGLDHSNQQSALMAPYYNPQVATPQPRDDIPRIQKLYGAAPTPPTPTDPRDAEQIRFVRIEGRGLKVDVVGQ